MRNSATNCLSLLIFFSVQFSAFSQKHNPGDSTYMARLMWGDFDSRCNLVFFGFNYLGTPKTTAFAAKGTHFFVGLNVMRFFSDKVVFGPFLETKQSNGGLKQPLSSEFISAFNESYTPITDPEMASLESQTFYGAMNELDGFAIRGNKFWNVGLAFCPFPDRYGSIMVKVSKGSQAVTFGGPYNDQIYLNDDGCYLDLYLERKFAIELVIRPLTFGVPKHVTIHSMRKVKDVTRLLSTSFYIERLQMGDGVFRTTQLSSFIEPEFLKNHPKMLNVGFKIGFGLW